MLEAAAARLGAAGARIIDSELPADCTDISEIQRRHSAYEAPRNHAPELYRHAALLSDDLLANGRIAGRPQAEPRRFPRRLAPGRAGAGSGP